MWEDSNKVWSNHGWETVIIKYLSKMTSNSLQQLQSDKYFSLFPVIWSRNFLLIETDHRWCAKTDTFLIQFNPVHMITTSSLKTNFIITPIFVYVSQVACSLNDFQSEFCMHFLLLQYVLNSITSLLPWPCLCYVITNSWYKHQMCNVTLTSTSEHIYRLHWNPGSIYNSRSTEMNIRDISK
jgi:hypothetical protein